MSQPVHLDEGISCPICRQGLRLQQGLARPARLSCPDLHAFDAAKQGYFNLLTGKGTSFREDGSAMVAARAAFLDAGHYAPFAQSISTALAASLSGVASPRILDAGAGTGYYLGQLLAALPASATAVALDISKFAMRRAAKIPSTLALVWDLWRDLPLEDAAFDGLINVFSPHNGAEFARVLRPGGSALVITPLPEHLMDGAELLGLLAIAEDKAAGVIESMGENFALKHTSEIRVPLILSPKEAFELAMMGPAGHHADPQRLRERVENHGEQIKLTAAFRIQEFTRN
ncbi:SAM-dependent methyltransferase [Arthrobacter sp. MYb227]|uniref:putative RNA methyltransferase n=1 Tax=Arthrobacter sp. MYb227 TaxID=1848601 RepID=UPI000CFABDED|nr:methyltransferase domain-containing protein [Arthrobacter sp. MYb227]PQZ93897.1 SAM-dependent methyltransferase [Arthrobacter sp. MYb227]